MKKRTTALKLNQQEQDYQLIDQKIILSTKIRAQLNKKIIISVSEIHEFFNFPEGDPVTINRCLSPFEIWSKFRNIQITKDERIKRPSPKPKEREEFIKETPIKPTIPERNVYIKKTTTLPPTPTKPLPTEIVKKYTNLNSRNRKLAVYLPEKIEKTECIFYVKKNEKITQLKISDKDYRKLDQKINIEASEIKEYFYLTDKDPNHNWKIKNTYQLWKKFRRISVKKQQYIPTEIEISLDNHEQKIITPVYPKKLNSINSTPIYKLKNDYQTNIEIPSETNKSRGKFLFLSISLVLTLAAIILFSIFCPMALISIPCILLIVGFFIFLKNK
ncbi:hypothetical protein MHSWG343_09410 [Candidatus Mycoplasma haematohominis]|uniref:Uncharacterized protein n=1 Tax=Candidatus Mycoplasma haematohominis TaxID=1494318 RepID=A0A478FS81_9MOLU|nr:hypothetical protein MHSWG343_09410 [Candidatus Mycoplasma haemohominis]